MQDHNYYAKPYSTVLGKEKMMIPERIKNASIATFSPKCTTPASHKKH
jgi:hypothetical protein